MLDVVARNLRLRIVKELLLPPIKRPAVQLDYFVRLLLPGFEAAIIDHLRQFDARLFRDELDRFRKRQALDLHHELERVTALVTAEAVKNSFRGTDRERRRLFLVKRTARHPIRTLLL